MPSKTSTKRPKTVMAPCEKTSHSKQNISENVKTEEFNLVSEKNENLIVKKITGTFDNFDESQHLNGCPMKWLYNKKLLEKYKMYKTGRLCNKKFVKKEDAKKEINKNLRDRTPIEVKIHKINLTEKYTNNCDEIYPSFIIPSLSSEKSEKSARSLEMHRKKLAAKLNWKFHDECQDDSSPEISSRYNYLPPRPLLGLKPLLSVLLIPHQETNCCSLISLQNSSQRKKKEASLSIQSLNLPTQSPEYKVSKKTTNPLRWGSKSSSTLTKKFQIPNPITIKLNQRERNSNPNAEINLKVLNCNLPAKKTNEKFKQTKSLSSLFYELKGKTNYRNRNEKYFEEMIRDLTMEEEQFKIKRFLSMNSTNPDLVLGCNPNPEERKKSMEMSSGDDSELNLICEKIRLFEKKKASKNRETN